MKDNLSELTKLGSNQTDYTYDKPSSAILETFENKFQDNDYEVTLDFPEFTSLCPRTGQPDFGKIKITYIPDKKCVESKSLKLYFFSWRNEGSFMETITNRILRDFCAACSPRFCLVAGLFNARGGITIEVEAIEDNRDDE